MLPPNGVPRRAPVHPGRFLQRYVLAPMAISQSEAARRLGISRRRVNEIVMGHRAMSPDTAIRCAMAFGLAADEFLTLQAQWDCYHAWKQLRRTLAPAKPVSAPRNVRADHASSLRRAA
jgi:addiction module HigA family antidote